MTATRLHNGAWRIYALVEDGSGAYLLTRSYYGYTKREAVARFREECDNIGAVEVA